MKKYKVYFLLVSIIFLGLVIYAQHTGEGKMKGVVTDEEGKPLADVVVKLFNNTSQSGFDTKTDANGTWKAFWVRGGSWDIDFQKTGYETKRISIAITQRGGKPYEADVQMKKMVGLTMTVDLLKELDKGNELFGQQKYDEAITQFQSMLEKSPESFIVNLNIGNCYFEKKMYDKAIEFYQKVLDKEPTHVKAIIAVGNSFTNKGDNKTAIDWYQKIDITKIDDTVVLYNIGIFYFNANDSGKAITYLKRAVEISPSSLDALYQLGLAYMNVNKNADAIKIYEQYLQYDAESERSKQVKEIIAALKQS